jgi:hypothetical protein
LEADDKPSDTDRNAKKEVNRFFGWAIHSMTKRIRKKLKGVKKDQEHDNAEATNQELELLLEMRVFEHQILDETTYLQNFYSTRDRLINNGWLTLVSPKYADLGHAVMSVISGVATPVSIRENGNKWAEVVKKEASERIQSRELVENFLVICVSSKLSDSRKIRLFEQMIEKTINARMGFAYRVYKLAVLDRSGERENLSAFRGKLLSISGAQRKKKVKKTTKS